MSQKAEIISQLRQDLLSVQGFKPGSALVDVGLGTIVSAFPNRTFPTGVLHEFISDATEDAAATCGFISTVLAPLMKQGGTCIWIRASHSIFPPSLTVFGIQPDKLVFIDLKAEKQVLWAAEEALKCDGLAAVIFEVQEISLLASRRLQLAAERSGVTGFAIRYQPITQNPIASAARWRITSSPSELQNGIPGMGFPRWQIDLLKVRNGKPGTWNREWIDGSLLPVRQSIPLHQERTIRKIV